MKMVILFIVLINLVNAQDPADVCYECQNTYSYHESSKKCVKCQTKDGTATGVSICSECKTNGEQKCDSGKCAEGYYLETADGTNKNKCVACTANCKTCSTTGDEKCSVCKDTYTLVKADGATEGHCVQCSLYCKKDKCTTNGNGKCDECEDGYYLDSTSKTCLPCSVMPGCTRCTSDKKCTACSSGLDPHHIDDDTADTCPTCAAYCTSGCNEKKEGKCDSACTDGYYLVPADDAVEADRNTCKACPSNCKKCDTDHAKCDAAEKCDTGFGKSEAGLCVKCSTGCNDHKCSVAGQCDADQCGDYYYYQDDTIADETKKKTCQPCPANCKQCNTNHGKCDAAVNCDTGYGLSTDGQCVLCDTNCNDHQCTEANKCNANQCKPGYYRKDDGTCARCNSGTDDTSKLYYCDQCSDATHCTKCLEGENAGGLVTRLVNDECAICGMDCLKCTTSVTGKDNSGLCDTDGCAPGFYYSDGLCPSCPSECAACSDANTCTKCITGYYLDETSHSCKRCNNKNEGTVASTNHCSKCTKDPEPPAPQDDSSVMVSIVLGLIALIALF